MKKNVIYIIIAALIGMFMGYLIFGGDTTRESIIEKDNSAETSGQMWTCSMHPQIMQSESGDCPICGMDLVHASTTQQGLSVDQFSMTENAMALANIQTSVVGMMSSESKEVKLSGKIKENEETNTVQVTHFSGRVEKLLVNSVGEKIYKGQTIAILYSPELVAAQQELLTAAKLKKEQPELYKAVRNKLKLRKISEDQISLIESSGKIKETFPIHSHVSGVVSEKMVEEGNHVDRGQMLYKITNLNSLWASFDAYENQISLLKVGQRIKVKTNAYPNMDFDAEVSFIDPILDTRTRTINVRAVVANKNDVFKPGMFIEGTIEVMSQKSNKTITIPKSAVLWTGKRSIVYVKTQSDRPIFEMREVVLGTSNKDEYVILNGVQEGEIIVTNGTFTVDAAAQLQGKKSMMNRSKVMLPDDFQREFNKALVSYFLLKDALVESNTRNASIFSGKMLSDLRGIDTKELKGEIVANVKGVSKLLEVITEKENLIDQRNHFVSLNESLESLVKKMDYISDNIYIQKCPMADNNKGAIWLSKEEEIRNPYFGNEMLTCGSVVSILGKK
ncbi:membrane fusion protein, Cu(I)/Ag(I) efflux system [Aquimarina amphilecti]|uniref:Membrane fusion protein, Cu(I)/Ag(I) efflux system n=1 Tax=Aquimarina amphilecti TaxID=1038014 RepID=A0A1H7RXP6_AQUAM|nr:efflux RND transporter periplasmic adaptor subunit [Aquimarina amphilecti]SEL64858.1 membrane fusion protein, Cu(I)/Ag(I) efflux system [Aquimarina amphilecti]